jgi:hypothetical protein
MCYGGSLLVDLVNKAPEVQLDGRTQRSRGESQFVRIESSFSDIHKNMDCSFAALFQTLIRNVIDHRLTAGRSPRKSSRHSDRTVHP